MLSVTVPFDTDQPAWVELLYIVIAVVLSVSHVRLLQPHDLRHTSFPVLQLSPRVCSKSNSCPLNRWCHPTISSSVAPFSCPQSFPALGSFPVSWLFTSDDQSIGASASASVLPKNSQDWFPLGLTGWISLLSKGLSRVFSSTTDWKHQFLRSAEYLWSQETLLHTSWQSLAMIWQHLTV